MFCKSGEMEKQYSSSRLHTGTGAVEREIQTLKILIIANLEDKIVSTENINRAFRVMRFTIRTKYKVSSFELLHGRETES